MLSVQKIIDQIRLDSNDTGKKIYSDWQIVMAINKAVRLLSQQFAIHDTDFCEKSVQYELRDVFNGADLPMDFIRLVDVHDGYGKRLVVAGDYELGRHEYKITGQKLYANQDVTMVYRAMPDEAQLGGYINIPITFFDVVCTVTRMVLGDTSQEELTQYVTDNAMQMIPRRKYSNIRLKMPFRV